MKTICPVCEGDVEQTGRGRPRTYCSVRCRGLAHREAESLARERWPGCSVRGCFETVRSARQTLCEKHYGRLRRYGALHPQGRCQMCGGALEDGRATYCSRVCQLNYDKYLRYGLTPSEGAVLEAAANGVCEICGVKQAKRLHLDHDHATGLWRGFLCGPCNTGLGMFGDDIERLRSAIEYLIKER